MAMVIGTEGGALWLAAVLFLLAVGLAGALLAAVRADTGPARGERPRRVASGPVGGGRRSG